jgi:hypothetical protein
MFKVAEDVVAPAPSARVEHTTSRLKALWQKYGTPVLVVLLAVAVGDAIGRRVAFVDVPPEAFASALARAGVPQWQVDGLIEDYAHLAAAISACVTAAGPVIVYVWPSWPLAVSASTATAAMSRTSSAFFSDEVSSKSPTTVSVTGLPVSSL